MPRLCLLFRLLILSAISLFSVVVLAQQTPPATFLQKIAAAYNSQGRVPASLSLTGSGTWTAGSLQESGSLVEVVASDGSTTEEWTFPTVSHTQTQGVVDFTGFSRACSYSDANNKKHDVLGRNCVQGVPWFHPSFVLSPGYAASTSVTDVTTEADTAQGLVRLTYSHTSGNVATDSQASTDLPQTIRKGTAVTVLYDAQTALPSRLEFKQAADQDEMTSLDVAVTFGDYRSEGGFMVPHHIQRYLQRTLVLDFVVTNVSVQ